MEVFNRKLKANFYFFHVLNSTIFAALIICGL